jgi:hypothetical protein
LDVIFNLEFHLQGNLLAVGMKSGCVQVWDVVQSNLIKVMQGQSGRMDALAWNGDVLTSGSYNGLIMEHNVRTPSLVLEIPSVFHEGEVSRDDLSSINRRGGALHQFPRHISRRKTVPTHGTLIAPNYPASHYRVYMTCKILALMEYNIVER